MPKTLLPLFLLLLPACSRLELARDQLLQHIDALLGDIDVKAKQASAAVVQLAAGVDQVTKARIDVQVHHTRLSEDLTAVQEKIARTPEGHPRQRLVAEVESLRTSKARLGRVLELLTSREEQARDRLQNLRLLLSQIDSKQVALKALRRAVEVCEAGTLDFRRVEAEVRELETEIDSELQFQEIRLNEFDVEQD